MTIVRDVLCHLIYSFCTFRYFTLLPFHFHCNPSSSHFPFSPALTNDVTLSSNVLSFFPSFLFSNQITESQPSLREAGDLRAQGEEFLRSSTLHLVHICLISTSIVSDLTHSVLSHHAWMVINGACETFALLETELVQSHYGHFNCMWLFMYWCDCCLCIL